MKLFQKKRNMQSMNFFACYHDNTSKMHHNIVSWGVLLVCLLAVIGGSFIVLHTTLQSFEAQNASLDIQLEAAKASGIAEEANQQQQYLQALQKYNEEADKFLLQLDDTMFLGNAEIESIRKVMPATLNIKQVQIDRDVLIIGVSDSVSTVTDAMENLHQLDIINDVQLDSLLKSKDSGGYEFQISAVLVGRMLQ